jgi:hypothetical protein
MIGTMDEMVGHAPQSSTTMRNNDKGSRKVFAKRRAGMQMLHARGCLGEGWAQGLFDSVPTPISMQRS